VGPLLGHNEAGLSVTVEAGFGGHRSGTKHGNNPCGPVMGDYLTPSQQGVSVSQPACASDMKQCDVPHPLHQQRPGHCPQRDTQPPP